MELRNVVKDKKFWMASFLIAWAAALQGHMMWLQRQDSFKHKFGNPDDHPHNSNWFITPLPCILFLILHPLISYMLMHILIYLVLWCVWIMIIYHVVTVPLFAFSPRSYGSDPHFSKILTARCHNLVLKLSPSLNLGHYFHWLVHKTKIPNYYLACPLY